MNFTVFFANDRIEQFLGDDDSYEISESGVLKIDVTREGKRLRRFFSQSSWQEVSDREPS